MTDDPAEVYTGLTVDAPPERVWAVLADPEGYVRWNALFSLSGPLREGARVTLRLRVPGLPPALSRARVTEVVPGRELRWSTRLPGLRADHAFELAPLDDGARTEFVQRERFSGPLGSVFVDRFGDDVRRGFERFNRRLARYTAQANERANSGSSRD